MTASWSLRPCFAIINALLPLYNLMWLLEFQALQLHSRKQEGGKKEEKCHPSPLRRLY